MTELDRRVVITGLAAVAVARVVPPLPLVAATTVIPVVARRTGCCFCHLAPHYADLAPNIGHYRLTSTWHYHAFARGEAVIRHLPTGLTFITTPREITPRTAVELLTLSSDPPSLTFSLGHAARSIAIRACPFRDPGAIFLSYATTPSGAVAIRQPAPPLLAPGFSRANMEVYPA
jgi:hypothetical protein